MGPTRGLEAYLEPESIGLCRRPEGQDAPNYAFGPPGGLGWGMNPRGPPLGPHGPPMGAHGNTHHPVSRFRPGRGQMTVSHDDLHGEGNVVSEAPA